MGGTCFTWIRELDNSAHVETCLQGYGLFTLEEQRYSPEGFLLTRGPGAYKIPGFTDIPVQLNVAVLKGASNPKAVYSSKVSHASDRNDGETFHFIFRERGSIALVRLQILSALQAVGEPPLFLSASVFFAIYDAIGSARREEGLDGFFRLDSPATAEKIRMACVDRFTRQVR